MVPERHQTLHQLWGDGGENESQFWAAEVISSLFWCLLVSLTLRLASSVLVCQSHTGGRSLCFWFGTCMNGVAAVCLQARGAGLWGTLSTGAPWPRGAQSPSPRQGRPRRYEATLRRRAQLQSYRKTVWKNKAHQKYNKNKISFDSFWISRR